MLNFPRATESNQSQKLRVRGASGCQAASPTEDAHKKWFELGGQITLMRKRESNKQPDSPKVLMTVRVLEEGCTTFVKEWMKADEITGILPIKKYKTKPVEL